MHNVLDLPASAGATARRGAPWRVAATQAWTLSRILDILRRRFRFILVLTAAMVAAALLYLALSPDRYTATATLIPDTKRTPPSPTEVDRSTVIDPAVVEDQIETIRSEKVALAVIERLALWRDPEFVAPRPMDRLLASIGIGEASPAKDAELARRIALARFLRMTAVTRVGRSDVATIGFTAQEPDKAATIANAITDAYIQDQLGLRFSNAERTTRWAQQRLRELSAQEQAATQAVESYRSTNEITLGPDGKTEDEREFERQTAARARVRADLGAAQQRAAQVRAVREQAGEDSRTPDAGELQALNSPALSALLRDTQQRAGAAGSTNGAGETETGPREQISAELQRLDAAAQKEVEAAGMRFAELARRVEDLRARIAADGPKLERLRELEANQRRLAQLRDLLQTRYARVADFVQQQSLPVTEARVLADATPPLSRSSPKTLLILALGVFAGLGVGALGALAREHLDRTVTRPGQLEDDMNLRCLGVLPCVTGRAVRKSRAGLLPLASDRWMSEIAGEPLRGVKVAVDGTVAAPDGRVIAIASAEPGVGKSTVALSLAITVARAGFQTLLVDADLRQSSLTKSLLPGAQPKRTGTTGTPTVSNGIVAHPLGFDLLGQSAPPAQHPADVLASRGMQTLVQRLRGDYDYIIVDTPAMLVRIDVAAAAGLFDAIIMVAEYGRTRLDALGRALATSPRLADLVVGAVINKCMPAVRVTSS
jgi:succinoglycan biosynthesis transport protein ExoP